MTNSPLRIMRHRGLSLIELAVTIAILLSLVSILFIGARAWIRGSDRATCIMTIRSVQVATRSYQNVYGYEAGGKPSAENGTQDIAEHLHHKGYIADSIYQKTCGASPCGAGGSYSRPLPDLFPVEGELYMTCSLSGSDQHQPASHTDW